MYSFLIPFFNGERYLDSSLESVANQSYLEWEAILVDDGSQDQSAQIAKGWCEKDSRFRYLHQPNQGIVKALNFGLTHCKGEWIVRQDDDDLCDPDRLFELDRARRSDPGVDIWSSKVRIFSEEGIGSGFARYERWLNECLSHQEIEENFFVESPLVHPSVMIRHRLMKELNGYRDCGWPEDYDLWMRCWLKGARFAKVDRVLFHWRDHHSRLTRTHPMYEVQAMMELKSHFLGERYRLEEREIVLCGAGKVGKRWAQYLQKKGWKIAYFLDLHPRRIGKKIHGIEVLDAGNWDLKALALADPLFLATVGKEGGRATVREDLREKGLIEQRDFVCLA